MRVQGWETILLDSIYRHSEGGFKWGTSDCAIFAWKVRADILGKKEPPPWGTRYKTAAGAVKAIKKYGGGDFEQAVSKGVEGDPIPVELAQRGDVIAFPNEGREGFDFALGICVGKASAVLSEGRGLVYVNTYDGAKAWRTR